MNHLFPQSKIYLNYYKHQRTQGDTYCAYKALFFSGAVLENWTHRGMFNTAEFNHQCVLMW